jgi:hypothetical protein
MIFLDPFWNVHSLRKCKAGFSALVDSIYEAALYFPEGQAEAISSFTARNDVAQQTLRNLVEFLGGEDARDTVNEFFNNFPSP